MRMGMRRFTRLTKAFSKKVENLAAAVSLHFMYYNFARPHKTRASHHPPLIRPRHPAMVPRQGTGRRHASEHISPVGSN
jgi:hypothetical protein